MTTAHIFILIGMAVVLGILLTGVIGMARGGEFNKKYGNKLMQMRVMAQFIVIIMLILFALFHVGS